MSGGLYPEPRAPLLSIVARHAWLFALNRGRLCADRGRKLRYQFDWDPVKERSNIRKHHFSFRQAASVFRDPSQLSIYEENHSEQEDRWITLGLDGTGVLRVVIHTFEQVEGDLCRIRIISARKATKMEEQQYREANP
ncbi:MAG: BrnT family toxin [Dehalococcoidia bacterium]|nr:BrnT family toxin [Dehalococcoidia bacterium]